jgi:hypothetical protein
LFDHNPAFESQMIESHTGGIHLARHDSLRWSERTVRQLPSHTVGRHRYLVHLKSSGSSSGIDRTEPPVVLAASIHLSFEALRQSPQSADP